MRTFEDAFGMEWGIELHDDVVAKVLASTGLDMREFTIGGVQSLKLNNLCRLFRIVWFLVEPQAIARGILPVEFGVATGSKSHEVLQALIDAWIDYQPPEQRRVIRKALSKPVDENPGE